MTASLLFAVNLTDISSSERYALAISPFFTLQWYKEHGQSQMYHYRFGVCHMRLGDFVA